MNAPMRYYGRVAHFAPYGYTYGSLFGCWYDIDCWDCCKAVSALSEGR